MLKCPSARKRRGAEGMPDFERHESEDLEDYEVFDGTDTLDGSPGDDPLDRGVATPSHWSAGLRYAVKGEEESESLDEFLSEEEPDIAIDADDRSWDENATEQEIVRYEEDESTEIRAGRLVTQEEHVDGEGDTSVLVEDELVARDTGIDGGAATAEEAAMHIIGGSLSRTPQSDLANPGHLGLAVVAGGCPRGMPEPAWPTATRTAVMSPSKGRWPSRRVPST